MNPIILYSTHCPKCKMLTKRLDEAQIPYTEITEVSVMTAKGIMSVPTIEVDGQFLDFQRAWRWATEVKNGN